MYRFCGYVGLGEPAVRQDEGLTAQLRALALCPEPPMLYAALAGELAAMGLL